ncbi:MAG TPA: hypothetical protein VGM32_00515 [Rhodopila sp.]
MARDPLLILRTVRRRSVEAARTAVGECLTAEAEVAARMQAIDDAAQRDRAANRALSEAHQFLEMFTRRQASRDAERCSAAAELTAAQARSAAARAALVAARTAAEAVETLIEERAIAATAAAMQRDQHALDDIARTRVANVDRADGGGR